MDARPLGRHLQLLTTSEGKTIQFNSSSITMDEETGQEVADHLLGLVGDLRGQQLVLDFSAVTYLTSSFLGKIVALYKRLQGVGGKLVIREVQPDIYEIFRVTRLHSVLDIRPGAAGDGAACDSQVG